MLKNLFTLKKPSDFDSVSFIEKSKKIHEKKVDKITKKIIKDCYIDLKFSQKNGFNFVVVFKEDLFHQYGDDYNWSAICKWFEEMGQLEGFNAEVNSFRCRLGW